MIYVSSVWRFTVIHRLKQTQPISFAQRKHKYELVFYTLSLIATICARSKREFRKWNMLSTVDTKSRHRHSAAADQMLGIYLFTFSQLRAQKDDVVCSELLAFDIKKEFRDNVWRIVSKLCLLHTKQISFDLIVIFRLALFASQRIDLNIKCSVLLLFMVAYKKKCIFSVCHRFSCWNSKAIGILLFLFRAQITGILNGYDNFVWKFVSRFFFAQMKIGWSNW